MALKQIKSSLKAFIYKIYMPKEAYYFYSKAKEAEKIDDFVEAIEILEKGSKVFPENYQIHTELVNIAMRTRRWNIAVQHWETIFKIRKRHPKVAGFLGYAKALRFQRKLKQAEQILTEGLDYYPENEEIIQELADVLTKRKKWQKAAQMWDLLLEKDKNLSENVYLNAALSNRKLGNLTKAEKILQEGNSKLSSKRILRDYAYISIFKMNWEEALNRLNKVIHSYKKEVPMNLYIYKSMVHKIMGDEEQANKTFAYIVEHYNEKMLKDKKGYRKITIFNNGESKIDFYKKLKSTTTAIVTFDSLNMTWNKPSFGFKLLSRQNIDIIAVRKRQPNTQHQDLSIDDFYNAVHKLAAGYKHKVAYGYSLGGYTSLYYGSSINCTILSLAPRLSIHPVYGKSEEKSEAKFKHSLSLPYNSTIAPIVVYDPKQKLDNRFVVEEVLKAYPNSVPVKLPYGGHGIAPHLLRMGQLKEFILTVVNDNEVPKYNRKLKAKSNIYLRVLGQACLNRNKIKWAKKLVEESLKLLPTDKYAIKLKVNVLIKMECYEEAIDYARSAVELVPKVLDVRELLIDLYIQQGNLKAAEKELFDTIKIFGESRSLVILCKEIKKKRESILN